MVNKLKVILLTLLLFIIGHNTVNAAEIGLYLDGKALNTDVSPVIVQNRSFVPVRSIFEKMGAEVTWISSRKQVIIRSSSARVVLNIDSTTAYVDDDEIQLDVAPFIKEGRTMVPVRFISESLNYNVKWENNSVYITSKKAQNTTNNPKINKINIVEKSNSTDVSIIITNMEKPTISYADSPTRFTYSVKYSSTTMTISIKAKNPSSSTEEDREPTRPPVSIPDVDELIVIDAGHGGADCGAIGYDEDGEESLYESEVNLAIAQVVYECLTSQGISAVMTRDEDVKLGPTEMEDLLERSSIANDMGATFFVSIHCNSFTEPTATGTEILYADTEDKVYSGVTSKELAENVLEPLLEATGLSDRGLKDSPKIVVLRTTTMPSILVETAFISNPDDMAVLQDEDKIEEIGEAIAEGIIQSLGMLE